jgi:hypothetical protein
MPSNGRPLEEEEEEEEKQQLGKRILTATNTLNNRRTIGLCCFYVVHEVSNTQYVVKGE